MSGPIRPTKRTKLHRRANRASYDRDEMNAILDEAFVCHFGFVSDGQPYVIPTAFARAGDLLYVHGSSASRALKVAKTGIPVCLTVTILDGLVIARSALNNSMNYRSVVVLGVANEVSDRAEKCEALRVLTEHIVPGRWEDTRPPTLQELKATTVLALPLQEASAKIRTGGPIDEPEDLGLPFWAGVLPIGLEVRSPISELDVDGPAPAYLSDYRRPGQ